MRDYKKFCRPKTVKNPLHGDYEVTLNCGSTVYVSKDEFEKKINKYFKKYKKYDYYMKIIYQGDGENPVNFLLKKIDAFGETYNLDESSISKMILDGIEIKFEDLTLANKGEHGGTTDIYTYIFSDSNEHELIIYSNSSETLRFSGLASGPGGTNNIRFKNIKSVIINKNITSIGNYAFYNCSGLTSVTIPNSVTTIEYGAFQGCSGMTSVTIGNSVTSIGGSAFFMCSGLTSVTIPNSVTSIGSYSFNGCSGLTSVTIPNSVTGIGSGAFRNCYGLTSVTIGNGVTDIGVEAFRGCSSLTSITIGNSVTSIGNSAFSGCSGLTSITIPENVTSVGGAVCQLCTSLEVVTALPTTPPSINNTSLELFAYTSSNLVIYVPSDSVDAYKAASGWNTYADIIQAVSEA